VLTTIGDGKAAVDSNSDGVIDYFVAYIISVSDYSPFGVELANRSWSIEEYRNGFNGKELDIEGMGGGSSTYDYGFRIYNPALGKFLSVDPLTSSYPYYTPYQFAGNKPIWAVDLDGLEEFKVTGNTITITMKFAAFSGRIEGGNVPNESDIITLSKEHWKTYNNENSEPFKLSIIHDMDGIVTSVSSGETEYRITFDVHVEVFKNEKSIEYLDFIKNQSFTGVYLFGDTEFENNKIEHKKSNMNSNEITLAFTQSILPGENKSNIYNRREFVAFRDVERFTKEVEVHEDSHAMGLTHWGKNSSLGIKNKGPELWDPIYGNRLCFEDKECYDSVGITKHAGGSGSQAMKLTQVINTLNSMGGKFEK
jgi:RHS repeat-associated protein